MPEFSEKLLKLRKSCGWNQQFVADALGITRATVSMWENGLHKPGRDQILNLSRIFEVTPESLANDDADLEPLNNPKNGIPLLTYEALSDWGPTGAAYTPEFQKINAGIEFSPKDREVAVQIRDNSMGLIIPQHSFVIAVPCTQLNNLEYGFFYVLGHVMIGQLRQEGPRRVIHFEQWQDRELTDADCVLARIRRLWRDFPNEVNSPT